MIDVIMNVFSKVSEFANIKNRLLFYNLFKFLIVDLTFEVF